MPVVNQFYEAEILKEYVIRGNAAVLKCSIPSFVADFVRVESWIDELDTVLLADGLDYGECGIVDCSMNCVLAQIPSLPYARTIPST